MQTKGTKFEETAIIIRQEEIADDIYSMWLRTEHIAAHAKAGQFVSVYCNEGSRLLPRPISICEIDRKDGAIRLVYRVAGKGTAEFSGMRTGMQLKVVGPLGNGFPQKNKKAFLIGGGIGIPPMLELAKELDCEKQIVLGFRDELFLLKISVTADRSILQRRMAVPEQREMFLMRSVRTDWMQTSFMPVDQPRCCVQSKNMPQSRTSSAGFPWKSAWHAVSEPVLPACASQKKKMHTVM